MASASLVAVVAVAFAVLFVVVVVAAAFVVLFELKTS